MSMKIHIVAQAKRKIKITYNYECRKDELFQYTLLITMNVASTH